MTGGSGEIPRGDAGAVRPGGSQIARLTRRGLYLRRKIRVDHGIGIRGTLTGPQLVQKA